MIPDEPVRGRTPPPWFWALSGVERSLAFSRGLLPRPPMARLLGTRTTHVAAGTVTVAMPAAEAFIGGNGQLEITPLLVSALESAGWTALTGGRALVPLRFTFDPFRPAWPCHGNLIARARVVNSGDLFVFTEAQVEDPVGRNLGQCTLHSAVHSVERVPPPPETMRTVEEPTYETPDPYLRRFKAFPIPDLDREGGLNAIRGAWLDAPITTLYGFQLMQAAEGRTVSSIPASEWFSTFDDNVSWQAIAAMADMSLWTVATSVHRPGMSDVPLDSVTRFLRRARADGRRLRMESVAHEPRPNLFVAETRIWDADDQLVAMQTGSWVHMDATRRATRPQKESRRVLATLLFIDIVDSTGHAKRLGDAGWRDLLEEQRGAIRREVSRYNGTEVDTAGDGFFARFDSPVHAIDAACAARQATAALGIEIRTGIHSGECELEGSKLAGMAVHIASRIQAAAQPGEVLVSSTVKDLTVGSGRRFDNRGEQNLKGVPDPWRLYAVVD